MAHRRIRDIASCVSLASLCAGSLVGCGGSSTSPLTHAKLIAAADSICGWANHALNPGAVHGLTMRQMNARSLRIYDQTMVRLRGLHPRPADAPGYRRFVAAYAAQRPLIVAFQRAAGSGAETAPIGRLYAQIAQVGVAATSFGVSTCALAVDTRPAPTAQDYLVTVSSECLQLSSAIKTVPRPGSPADLAVWARRLDPLFDQAVRDFRGAEPATGQTPVTPATAELVALHGAIDATARALTSGNIAGIPAAVRKVGSLTAQFDRAAAAGGLSDCRL